MSVEGRRVLELEAPIATYVDRGDAAPLERARHQQPFVDSGPDPLRAHDRGSPFAREGHKPLDAGFEVGRRGSAVIVDGAAGAVVLGASRASTELAPEKDVLDRLVRERLRECAFPSAGLRRGMQRTSSCVPSSDQTLSSPLKPLAA
jgi:hypothetical protein